jgi:hypothetical protein
LHILSTGGPAVAVRVPTAAFQPKRTHGNQLFHIAAAARANRNGGIGYTLLNFKNFLAPATFVLVHRHHITSQLFIILRLKKRPKRQVSAILMSPLHTVNSCGGIIWCAGHPQPTETRVPFSTITVEPPGGFMLSWRIHQQIRLTPFFTLYLFCNSTKKLH